MAEQLSTHTEYQAQKLNQLLRADTNFNIGRNRFLKDGQRPQEIKVKSPVEQSEFSFTLDGEQVFTFWRIRRSLLQDLQKEGIGDIAMAILANRPQRAP